MRFATATLDSPGGDRRRSRPRVGRGPRLSCVRKQGDVSGDGHAYSLATTLHGGNCTDRGAARLLGWPGRRRMVRFDAPPRDRGWHAAPTTYRHGAAHPSRHGARRPRSREPYCLRFCARRASSASPGGATRHSSSLRRSLWRVARDSRAPIPITVRFPASAETDEQEWQERVVASARARRLGAPRHRGRARLCRSRRAACPPSTRRSLAAQRALPRPAARARRRWRSGNRGRRRRDLLTLGLGAAPERGLRAGCSGAPRRIAARGRSGAARDPAADSRGAERARPRLASPCGAARSARVARRRSGCRAAHLAAASRSGSSVSVTCSSERRASLFSDATTTWSSPILCWIQASSARSQRCRGADDSAIGLPASSHCSPVYCRPRSSRDPRRRYSPTRSGGRRARRSPRAGTAPASTPSSSTPTRSGGAGATRALRAHIRCCSRSGSGARGSAGEGLDQPIERSG